MIGKIIDKIFIVFLIGIALVVILSITGQAKLLVVKSGSMEPAIGVNSLLLVRPAGDKFASPIPNEVPRFKTGEVITFTSSTSKLPITHRIVSLEEKEGQIFYQTKGDANKSPDTKLIPQSDILGYTFLSIPSVGNIVDFTNTISGFFLLIILPASFVLLREVLAIQEELKRVRIRKMMVAGSLVVLIMVTIPTLAVFTGQSLMLDNSLSTKESFIADHLVINEVYYNVDEEHGLDSPKDRGVSTTASNTNTGAGSTNNASANVSFNCTINQQNQSNVQNNFNVNTNTASNSASGNTGNGQVDSGDADVDIDINTNVGSNSASCGLGQNNEWIEIYNPTDEDVSLKNWTLMDNSGLVTTIHANKIIPAGGFALLSKSASTWRFWDEDDDAIKVELGRQIGDGLDNEGDHLILSNPSGDEIDSLSYGNDVSQLDPSIPLVTIEHSFERKTPGLDSDVAGNFEERDPPTPGI